MPQGHSRTESALKPLPSLPVGYSGSRSRASAAPIRHSTSPHARTSDGHPSSRSSIDDALQARVSAVRRTGSMFPTENTGSRERASLDEPTAELENLRDARMTVQVLRTASDARSHKGQVCRSPDTDDDPLVSPPLPQFLASLRSPPTTTSTPLYTPQVAPAASAMAQAGARQAALNRTTVPTPAPVARSAPKVQDHSRGLSRPPRRPPSTPRALAPCPPIRTPPPPPLPRSYLDATPADDLPMASAQLNKLGYDPKRVVRAGKGAVFPGAPATPPYRLGSFEEEHGRRIFVHESPPQAGGQMSSDFGPARGTEGQSARMTGSNQQRHVSGERRGHARVATSSSNTRSTRQSDEVSRHDSHQSRGSKKSLIHLASRIWRKPVRPPSDPVTAPALSKETLKTQPSLHAASKSDTSSLLRPREQLPSWQRLDEIPERGSIHHDQRSGAPARLRNMPRQESRDTVWSDFFGEKGRSSNARTPITPSLPRPQMKSSHGSPISRSADCVPTLRDPAAMMSPNLNWTGLSDLLREPPSMESISPFTKVPARKTVGGHTPRDVLRSRTSASSIGSGLRQEHWKNDPEICGHDRGSPGPDVLESDFESWATVPALSMGLASPNPSCPSEHSQSAYDLQIRCCTSCNRYINESQEPLCKDCRSKQGLEGLNSSRRLSDGEIPAGNGSQSPRSPSSYYGPRSVKAMNSGLSYSTIGNPFAGEDDVVPPVPQVETHSSNDRRPAFPLPSPFTLARLAGMRDDEQGTWDLDKILDSYHRPRNSV